MYFVKRYDVETLLIDKVLNKEHLYEKIHVEHVHQKLIPDPFLILVNNPKQYVFVCHQYVTRMYLYVIRMSLLCTRMASVCARVSLVCTCISSVCRSYVLVCYPYVTRMYSYVIHMSLVCTRRSSVCHSYVVLPWIVAYRYLSSEIQNLKRINFWNT